jgi:hypothetical protein
VNQHIASLRVELSSALAEVGAAFEPGELAFLALTSKPEALVRDRLGWALTKSGRRVAREWPPSRCDLAVLGDGGEPLALVELKATHTGSMEWGRAGNGGVRASFAEKHGARTYLEGLIRADAAKARALAGSGEAYVLVVVTHVGDPVPPSLDAFVKYGRELRAVADRQQAEQTLAGYLAPLGEAAPVDLGGGEAFGIRATVNAWLCGPIRARELW